jgi:hypothetical protein
MICYAQDGTNRAGMLWQEMGHMRNAIAGMTIALVLSAGAGSVLSAQSGAKEETKKAGSAAKEAAKHTGEAAKDVAKTTGEAAKDAAKTTAKATKKGAAAVKKAVTGDAHATCVDGSVQAGSTEVAAAAGCAGHGGVAKP